MRALITLILIFMLVVPASNAHSEGREFYKRGAEGWFWYHDPEPEPEPEEKEEPELPVITPPPAESSETTEAPKGPPAFSVAWYQENMETVLNRAIDDPTEENVAAYFFIHRLMMDKANQFAVTAREVSMKHPQLDEMTRKGSGATAVRMTEAQKRKLMADLGERVNARDGALWFWFQDDIYSRQMARIIRTVRNRTGIKVVALSVTGEPLSGEAKDWFPDYLVDSGNAAKRIGVTHAPAVALALPPNEVKLISHGVIGASHVQKRMMIAANSMDLITDSELAVFEGRAPGSQLIDMDTVPDIAGNDTNSILEVMSETFGY